MPKDTDKPVREGKVGMSFRVTPEVRKLIRHYMVEHDLLQLDELLLQGLVCMGVLPQESLAATIPEDEDEDPGTQDFLRALRG